MSDLIDFTEEALKNNVDGLTFKQNKEYLPQHPARILMLGPSGCGKSTLLANFLLDKSRHRLNYTKVILVCKDPTETLYEYLARELTKKEDKIRTKLKKMGESADDFSILTILTALDDLPEVNDIDKTEQWIIIIDDFTADRDQQVLESYFIRARKRNVTLIYLSQNMRSIPKIIRDQMGYVYLWNCSGGSREVGNLAQSYGSDLDTKTFRNLFSTCTRGKNFLSIDLRAADRPHKYKCGLTRLSIWEDS